MNIKVGDKVVLVDRVPKYRLGIDEDIWEHSLCGKIFEVIFYEEEYDEYQLENGYYVLDEHIKRVIRPSELPDNLFTLE